MQSVLKRGFDVITVFISAPMWLPILAILALLVRYKMGSPIFFRQRRIGLNAVPFELIKFRTMRTSRDENGQLLSDAHRLSAFGKWLRSTSMDELPELFLILKGTMSLVGPRPLLPEYLPYYTAEQAKRHGAKPGLTGWAQVNGRNAISWEKKFEMDTWYVRNQSLSLDVKILALTVKSVLCRDGISSKNEPTMPYFQGSNLEDPPIHGGL